MTDFDSTLPAAPRPGVVRRLAPLALIVLPIGGIAKLMHQLMQAAQGVPKAVGDFRPRQLLYEIGPQRFVLTMGGVAVGQESLSQIH